MDISNHLIFSNSCFNFKLHHINSLLPRLSKSESLIIFANLLPGFCKEGSVANIVCLTKSILSSGYPWFLNHSSAIWAQIGSFLSYCFINPVSWNKAASWTISCNSSLSHSFSAK